MFHLFSGIWGDGTSGRIIVYRDHYLEHGYCDNLFPRQFDELALLLTVLTKEQVTFVSREGVDLFELSGHARSFKNKSLLGSLNKESYDFGEVVVPMCPRGPGYVNKDEQLKVFQAINAFYSMALIAANPSAKIYYRNKLLEQQDRLLNLEKIKDFESYIFFKVNSSVLKTSCSPTVYSVVRSNTHCLKGWYEYYKRIGIERFILIDAQRSNNISEKLPYKDVHVFNPIVGNSRLFGYFWVKFLQAIYQAQDSWSINLELNPYLDF